MQAIRSGRDWRWLGRFGVAWMLASLPALALEVQAVLSRSDRGTSYVLTDAGRLWCWGANDTGQYGDGTTVPRLAGKESPLPEGVEGWRQFRAGLRCLALDQDGRLFGWGEPELAVGVAATNTPNARELSPKRLGTRTWRSVAVPSYDPSTVVPPFGLGADAAGGLLWLRMPQPPERDASAFAGYREDPVALPVDAGPVVEVAGGAHCFLALTEGGRVFAAGVDAKGVRGPRGTADAPQFQTAFLEVDVPAGAGAWTRIKVVGDAAFAWTQAGGLYVWGTYMDPDAGFSRVFREPRRLPDLPSGQPVRDVVGQGYATIAYQFLDAGGKLYGCGPGTARWPVVGPYAADLFQPKTELVLPPGCLPVGGISGNARFQLLAGGDGRVRALGENGQGQIGVVSQGPSGTPQPVVPSGMAPFLSGIVPQLPILDLFAGSAVVVEPTSPQGTNASVGNVSLVRSGRVDQAVTPVIRVTPRLTNGVAVLDRSAAELVPNLRLLPFLVLESGHTRYEIPVIPTFREDWDDSLWLDYELEPSPWYELGAYPRARVAYTATIPDNPGPKVAVIWPPAGSVVTTGSTLDYVVRFSDPDGHVTRVEIDQWGPLLPVPFRVLDLPPVSPGTVQTLLVSVPVSLPRPEETLNGTVTVQDNRGNRRTVWLGNGAGIDYRVFRSRGMRLGIGGREMAVRVPPTLGTVVLESSPDLTNWTEAGRYSVGTGVPSGVLELGDGDLPQRFYRLRNPDLPEATLR